MKEDIEIKSKQNNELSSINKETITSGKIEVNNLKSRVAENSRENKGFNKSNISLQSDNYNNNKI